MSLMAIGAAASIGTSLFGASSAKKAAKKQAAAQEAAARKQAETTKELAGNQKEFDLRINQLGFTSGLESLNIQTKGQADAVAIERRANANLRTNTMASYGLQRSYIATQGRAALEDEAATAEERVALSVSSAMRNFQIRSETISKLMGQREKDARLAAGETFASAEDSKSDVARKADQELATLRVASGERGAATTNTHLRLMNETGYWAGIDIDRIDRKAQAQVDALENDLVTAAIQASADLQMAQSAVIDAVASGEQSIRETNRSLDMKSRELRMQIEQLTMQQMFDLEALDLTDESLTVKGDQLKAGYDYAKKTLGKELELSNEKTQFVYDQTVKSADAMMDSNIALAMANNSAAVSLANSNMLSGIFSSFSSIGQSYLGVRGAAMANGVAPPSFGTFLGLDF